LLGQPFQTHEDSSISQLASNEVGAGVGYTPQQVVSPGSRWTVAQILGGSMGQYLVLAWTFTGPTSVYGYYVSDDSFGVGLWAELLPNSYAWSSAAPVFALQLNVQLVNLPGVS
jgi:hypothetical protein